MPVRLTTVPRRGPSTPLSTNPLHPEDQGVQLSDDERKTLAVYPMDLGGQYYARQNTGFMPFLTGDPVTPTTH